MQENDSNRKMNKLFVEYLETVSSDENSLDFLKEEGFDPEQLINEGLKKIKQVKMRIASTATESSFASVQMALLSKAKQEVDKLLGSMTFSLEAFIKKENINVAYRNFDKMSQDEIRQFLEHHYLLKLEQEGREKKNDAIK